jgi:hypothetical protein
VVIHDETAGQDGQINDENERDEEERAREELEFFFGSSAHEGAFKPGAPLFLPKGLFPASAKEKPPSDFYEITGPVIRSPCVQWFHLLRVEWN